MAKSLKENTKYGVIWSAIERFSSQLITFIVIIIMSRILTKSDYGLVGMLTIFIDVGQTIADSGVSQALIRKTNRSQRDCSTAFYFNLIISVVIYIILYICAPFISRFYEQPSLLLMTRIISLSLVFNALMMTQRAIFTANLDFKKQTKASAISSIASGIIGILMAYWGFGVWAIVYYQLIKVIFNGFLLWKYSTWRPSLELSMASLRYFFTFGSKLTVAGIMHSIYRNMYLSCIGKFYSPASVGIYSRAYQFGQFPSDNVGNILQRVVYPILCSVQDDKDRLKHIFGRFLRLTTFMVFPIMIVLSVLAEPLVVVVVGEKWIESSPLLSILSLSMMWIPLDMLNLSLLQVRGRTDYYLKCEIWKKIFGVLILVLTIPMGLIIICWGQVLRVLIDMVVDTYYTGKFIDMGFVRQVWEIMPSIIYSIVTGFGVWLSVHWIDNNVLKLIVGVLSGSVLFLMLVTTFGSSDFKFFKDMLIKRNKE